MKTKAEKMSLFLNMLRASLEIVSTDWRPVAKVSFAKDRGKDRREDQIIDFEQFISVKGVSALGNQLTKLKVNQIDLLDPLPYEEPINTPAEEIDVVGEELVPQSSTPSDAIVSESSATDSEQTTQKSDATVKPKASEPENDISDEGQITMF